MAGNSFGILFKITTFGESHGAGLGVVIDGVPPLIDVSEADIQKEMDRRRPGQSRVTTARQESDHIEVLSGIFEGKTLGTPIALIVRNTDARSKDYGDIKDKFRPGHADFTFQEKFGIRDYRGGGRQSGRETAARVAAGAIAKKILEKYGVRVTAYTLEAGGVRAEKIDFDQIEKNMVRSPDAVKAIEMVKVIEAAAAAGDSVGGIIEAVVQGCPSGLGEPVFDKLEARLSAAVMSIGTIKGVEFGLGFGGAKLKGSQYNDAFYSEGGKVKTRTNNSGGIQGGISNGQDIVLRGVVRPTSSILISQETVNRKKEADTIKVEGRHDPCICPRVVPVVEAMIAVTLVDALLIQQRNEVAKRTS